MWNSVAIYLFVGFLAKDYKGQTKMPANVAGTNKQLSDEELIEQIQNGDSESLDILIKAYLPKIYGKVQSLVPESDAEDVVQDIFLSLVDAIHSFKGKSAFSTWLHRIAMNKVADFHRKTSRRRQKLGETQVPEAFNPWAATNDELIVKQALMQLPERHRDILLLKFSEGLSFTEIADRLDVTYEATRSRYRRAIEAIREEIERDRDRDESRK